MLPRVYLQDLEQDDDERYEDEDADFEAFGPMGTGDAGNFDIPLDYMEGFDGQDDTSLAQEIGNNTGATKGVVGPRGRSVLCFKKLKLLSEEEIQARLVQVIDFMKTLDLDVTTFLYYFSWQLSNVVVDGKLRYARTALMQSEHLATILRHWWRPPRNHSEGIRTKAAQDIINSVSLNNVKMRVNKEMRELAPLLRTPPDEFDEKKLLSVNIHELIDETQYIAPTIWDLLKSTASTPRQLACNTLKNSDPVVLMCINALQCQRSSHRNLLQKFNSVYFKAEGTSARALDTLHLYGVTMCQKWVYRALETIAEKQNAKRNDLVQKKPFVAGHDNVNFSIKVYQPRLDNTSHFDSGTAGTVYIIHDVNAISPDPLAYQRKWREGVKNPIDAVDILLLDQAAAPRIREQAVWTVIRFLADTPAFKLETYKYKDNSIFNRPDPVMQLPIGPKHKTDQYFLDTVHIEEASLEGNEKVVDEYLRQLGIFEHEGDEAGAIKRLIPWVGDQLTTCRIRGLKKLRAWDLNFWDRLEHVFELFGWFHAQIAQEHSIHDQFYLTSTGMGLKQAFDLLGRKGLGAPSVAGNFHQKLQEALKHVAEARFRDLWRVVGGVDDLAALREKQPHELKTIAEKIISGYASTIAVQKHARMPKNQQDHVLLNSILLCRDLLDYLDLDDAMRTGDVGRIRGLLPRLLFRYHGGTNSKYVGEILELIQGLEREWPDDLCTFILRYCWLANTSGKPEGFAAYDLLQEHNIRDIKVIFMVLGPFATWEYIKKISASIPTQRKVRDHVEEQFNHFRRGRSHTDPDKEIDVEKLVAAYKESGIHVYTSKRQLTPEHRAKDFIQMGSDPDKLDATINRWLENRLKRRSKTEDYAPEETTA